MVNRNLLRSYDLPADQLERELVAAFGEAGAEWLPPESQRFQENRLLNGRVLRVTDEEVVVMSATRARGSSRPVSGTTRGSTGSCRRAPATRSSSCCWPSRTRRA